MGENRKKYRVVFWGTYDTGKPRTRIMLRGLKDNGIQVLECHADVWGGIEDKSQVFTWPDRLRLLVKWLSSYPKLILNYMKLPRHDIVIIGYIGQLDVLILWPFAKLRGVPIVWDAFLSLYNTMVEDRKLIGLKHPLASLLFAWEWLTCRAADLVVLDTAAHGQYFVDSFGLPPGKVGQVFVGAETDVFRPKITKQAKSAKNGVPLPFTALFYGQFIPLHGITTIVRAVKLVEKEEIRWILIGKGQESEKISNLVNELRLSNLEWIEWVPYEDLLTWIHSADVCLGIFGDTDKAKRVIPNKVFQILASGRPLITGDTPAVRELLRPSDVISLVPVGDAAVLATAVRDMAAKKETLSRLRERLSEFVIGPKKVGKQLISEIERILC